MLQHVPGEHCERVVCEAFAEARAQLRRALEKPEAAEPALEVLGAKLTLDPTRKMAVVVDGVGVTAEQVLCTLATLVDDEAPGEIQNLPGIVNLLVLAGMEYPERELPILATIARMLEGKQQQVDLYRSLPETSVRAETKQKVGPADPWLAYHAQLLATVCPQFADEAASLPYDDDKECRAFCTAHEAKLRWYVMERLWEPVGHEVWLRRHTRSLTRLKAWIAEDLAAVRADFERCLLPDQSSFFEWHGASFWVDRVRRLILEAKSLSYVEERDWKCRDSLPDDGELGEANLLMDVYAGERLLINAGDIIGILAKHMRRAPLSFIEEMERVRLINLLVAQPTINPAFSSLFWMALADDLGPAALHGACFHDIIGPLMYVQREYPTLIPAPAEVRGRQIDFVEQLFPGSTKAQCSQLSEQDWAARCEALARAQQSFLDWRCFAHVLSEMQSLHEPNMRELP